MQIAHACRYSSSATMHAGIYVWRPKSPPCRDFTPHLIKVYETHRKKGQKFEVSARPVSDTLRRKYITLPFPSPDPLPDQRQGDVHRVQQLKHALVRSAVLGTHAVKADKAVRHRDRVSSSPT